jgi:hypothetical protein
LKPRTLIATSPTLNWPKPWRRTGRAAQASMLWLGDRQNMLFAALVVVHLVPLWAFKYFPSQDGPSHIYNASVMRDYQRPDLSSFREYYLINTSPAPNWFGHLVLAGLMYLVPMLTAEKLLLSGYVILLPLSVRYALRAIRPEAGFLAVLAFPFIFNYVLHLGYYNFSYSLVVFFLLIGYWFEHRERFRLREAATLGSLALVLYFCHLVSLVMAGLAIGLLAVWLTLLDLARQLRERRVGRPGLWSADRTRALVPLAAFLPAAILAVAFLTRQGTAHSAPPPTRILLNGLLHLDSLVAYDEDRAIWFSTALVGLFVVVLLLCLVAKAVRRRLDRWDGLLAVVAAFGVVYFLAPASMSGGMDISPRLRLFPFFALLLWFGAQAYSLVVRRGIQAVALAIALAVLALNTMRYGEINDYLGEYLSGSSLVEPNATLLSLCFSHYANEPDGRPLAHKIAPFAHASSYISAERRSLELDNYEAQTSYFPLMFRPRLNPAVHIAVSKPAFQCPHQAPPRVDFLTYPQRTGGRVDYVLLWGARDEQLGSAEAKDILRQLEAGYELVYTSPQRGLVQLYRRKGWTGG